MQIGCTAKKVSHFLLSPCVAKRGVFYTFVSRGKLRVDGRSHKPVGAGSNPVPATKLFA